MAKYYVYVIDLDEKVANHKRFRLKNPKYIKDDFKEKKDHSLNQKLVNVRNTFEKYNLISALHTLFSKENKIYGNLLPPLSLLSEVDERNLLQSLKDLNFETKSQLAA